MSTPTELLDTPVAAVDLDKLSANIARFPRYLDQHGIANRPHAKTHKIPAIAHMQMSAGAVGVTCQKLGEAEVMAASGIADIFIPYNIVGDVKLVRLARLARLCRVSVTADHRDVVRGLSHMAHRSALELEVLVECDTGASRCGVQSPQEAYELASMISGDAHLTFGGLMTYPTTDATDGFVAATRSLLSESGISLNRVSGGGTTCMWQVHLHPQVTEHRAGIYVYGDRHTLRAGAMRQEDVALTVITTVVSHPTVDRAIIDAGSNSLSSDLIRFDSYGYVTEYPEARICALSQEHGHVDLSACSSRPLIGDRLTVIPNHSSPVSNLFDEVVGLRRGRVEVTWKTEARARVR